MSIEVRDVVIRKLLTADVPDVYPDALRYLNAEDSVYRRLAAEALRNMGNPASIGSLIKAYEGEPTPAVRHAIVTALSGMKSKEAAPTLINALYDRSATVRYAAISALALINEKDSVPALRDRLEDDSPSNAVKAAFVLKEKLGLDEKEIRKHLKDKDTRMQILAYYCAPSILENPGRFFEEAGHRKRLEKALGDSSSHLRAAALRCLGKLLDTPCGLAPGDAWLRFLADSYETEEDASNRAIIMDYLSRVGAKNLMKGFQEDYSIAVMRASNVRFLCYETDPVTIPVFLKALNDKALSLRMKALNALRFSRY